MKSAAGQSKVKRSKGTAAPAITTPPQPSIAKALAILYLFEPDHPEWSADEVCAQTRGSRPTVYRYIRELVDVGLLRRIPGGRYGLGPAIIRLDRVIRRTDPLLRAAVPIMRDLTERTACDCALTALFGRTIMDMHSEHGTDSLPRGYGRGQPIEMFRGSAAKVILAQQPISWQKRLYHEQSTAIANAGMATEWETFAAQLSRIRGNGYYISRGEVTPTIATLAVPISVPLAGYTAALSIVTTLARFDLLNHELIIQIMHDAVDTITESLGSQASLPVSPRFSRATALPDVPSWTPVTPKSSVTIKRTNAAGARTR